MFNGQFGKVCPNKKAALSAAFFLDIGLGLLDPHTWLGAFMWL